MSYTLDLIELDFDVPGSPCLSKTGPVYSAFFFFLKFIRPPVNGPKGSLAPCLVAAQSPGGLLETPSH